LPVGIVTINDNKNILVYPNPSSDRITIKFENNESQKFISEFFDTHGRMIKRLITHDSSFVIDLREWSSGVYFIRLQSEDGKVNSKGKLIVR
jgi:hypothetical protein